MECVKTAKSSRKVKLDFDMINTYCPKPPYGGLKYLRHANTHISTTFHSGETISTCVCILHSHSIQPYQNPESEHSLGRGTRHRGVVKHARKTQKTGACRHTPRTRHTGLLCNQATPGCVLNNHREPPRAQGARASAVSVRGNAYPMSTTGAHLC